MAAILVGCATPIMKPSEGHLRSEAPPPAGAIPAPVQISAPLPRPKPVVKPETYSVVVNDVKVHELLFALARDAKLNIDIHPGISGAVTLNAIEQTLPQLLSRIAKQVDMRWELDGPNLAVMPDTPYLRLYKIDYLNMDRSATGTVGVSSQISGGGGAGGGGTAGAGAAGGNISSTTLRNTSDNKFWDTLIKNVEEILRETDKVLPAGAQQAAAPAPPAAGQPPGQAPGGAQPPGAAAAPPTPAAPAPSATFREAASVIANKEAGLISIRATSRQHEKIQEFLDQVLANAKRQVLIEATIVEVQLNNEYQQGIDWSLLRRGPAGISISQTGSSFPQPSGSPRSAFLGALIDPSFRLGSLSATVRLLESFGNVRVLSSPKLSVLNNQTAILKVVDEIVYFTLQASTTAAANTAAVTTFTTTPNVTPVGFVMNVTPQIGESDTVLLNLRPSLTRVLRFIADPNPSLANPCGVPVPVGGCNVTPISSLIPEIQRREMESLIKVNSGQIAVMGGLIEERLADNDAGIPGLNRGQPFSTLFSQRSLTNAKTELVIFLRPVVIRDPSIDGDYRAFRVYAPDENFMAQPNPARPLLGGSESSR